MTKCGSLLRRKYQATAGTSSSTMPVSWALLNWIARCKILKAQLQQTTSVTANSISVSVSGSKPKLCVHAPVPVPVGHGLAHGGGSPLDVRHVAAFLRQALALLVSSFGQVPVLKRLLRASQVVNSRLRRGRGIDQTNSAQFRCCPTLNPFSVTISVGERRRPAVPSDADDVVASVFCIRSERAVRPRVIQLNSAQRRNI